MNKAISYSKNGAIICGAVNGLWNVYNQTHSQQNLPFNWFDFLKSILKGAIVGGAAGFVFGSLKDKEQKKILLAAGGGTSYLHLALNSYEKNSSYLEVKAQRIKNILNSKFYNYIIGYPKISGSISRGTNILDSDIDIQIIFRNGAGSIQSIKKLIVDYFYSEFNDPDLINIRDQNSSVGLIFFLDGSEQRIDIVPARDIQNGRGDIFLSVDTKQLFTSATIIKSNPKTHKNVFSFNEKQKKLIKLLKAWKINNDLAIPSIYLDLVVKRAFEEIKFPTGLLKALLVMIEFIGDNVTSIRLVDPANTNNVISNYLTNKQKEDIQEYCYLMLKNIKEDGRNLIDYFPNWEL